MMFELLNKHDWYGVSEAIEIAKGKYELTWNLKKIREQRKRAKKWQTKNGQ